MNRNAERDLDESPYLKFYQTSYLNLRQQMPAQWDLPANDQLASHRASLR